MIRMTVLAGLSLLALAGSAVAQEGAARGAMAGFAFDRIDADGDGRITRAEMSAARRAGFERMDTDGDGVLSAAEIAAMRDRARRFTQMAEAGGENRLARLDADGDGNLTFEEFDGRMPFFQLLDVDGDGAVSRAEFDRARTALMQ